MGCEVQEGGHTCGVGLVAESCPTLVNPWTVAHRAPLSMGFPRQEYLRGWPFPSPREVPSPGFEPASPALADRFSTTEPPGKPCLYLLASFFPSEGTVGGL